MKGIVVFLIITGTAAAAFAGGGDINLANLDKGVRSEMMKNAVDKPTVLEKHEYYQIKGNEANELRRQMTQNGIKWDDGKTYDALTTWNVKWDYDYKRSQNECSADSFKTTVDITFRFPQWVQTGSAPQPLVTRWNTYMHNLITHEDGHRDMAVREAADFASAAAGLTAPSCSELDREIDRLGRERMAKLNVDERNYDATTIHGTTQGAVFP